MFVLWQNYKELHLFLLSLRVVKRKNWIYMYMLKTKQLYRKQLNALATFIYLYLKHLTASLFFSDFEGVQLTCFTLDLAGSSTGGHVLVPELTERTLTGDSHPVLHLVSLITLEELVAIGVVFLVSDAIYNFRICTDIWKNYICIIF